MSVGVIGGEEQITSTSETITAGTLAAYIGYSSATSFLATAVGSRAGGPLYSGGFNEAVIWRSSSGGQLYLEISGDVRAGLASNFTKMVLDSVDYLFADNDYGSAAAWGTLNLGNTLLRWSSISQPMTDSSSYSCILE